MSNEEAIKRVTIIKAYGGMTIPVAMRDIEAIDMAIKALEEQERPTGNNEYKRGWNDALSKALEEAHTIHSEDGIFRVIQAETLIGLGYATGEREG